MVDVVAGWAVVVVPHCNDIPTKYLLQGFAVNTGRGVHMDIPVDTKHVAEP